MQPVLFFLKFLFYFTTRMETLSTYLLMQLLVTDELRVNSEIEEGKELHSLRFEGPEKPLAGLKVELL